MFNINFNKGKIVKKMGSFYKVPFFLLAIQKFQTYNKTVCYFVKEIKNGQKR